MSRVYANFFEKNKKTHKKYNSYTLNMLTLKKYDRTKASLYAQKYALTKNAEYFDYTNIGGNCTNYCSQCLFAGANKMNFSLNGWYYMSPSNTSVSWANVEPFYNFLTTNKKEGPFASESSFEMCEVGDFIQLKFKQKQVYSHCLIITKINSKTPNGIIVCANSRDILNKPLSFFNYEKMRILHILGYRETKT